MKFLIKAIIIALSAYLSHLFLPFWCIAVLAFLISLIIKTSGSISFFSGLLAGFLVWAISSYLIHSKALSELVNRISELLMLSPYLVIFITGLIGGLLSGLGSLCGSLLSSIIQPKDSTSY